MWDDGCENISLYNILLCHDTVVNNNFGYNYKLNNDYERHKKKLAVSPKHKYLYFAS